MSNLNRYCIWFDSCLIRYIRSTQQRVTITCCQTRYKNKQILLENSIFFLRTNVDKRKKSKEKRGAMSLMKQGLCKK